jgi:hypothetical protein
MCFGGPKTPNIVYQGPSQSDITANQAALDDYRARITEQQQSFTTQLNDQIAAANADREALQERLDSAAASAAAASAAQQTGAYAASASQSESTPATSQTTAAITKKKKSKSNLKIARAGTASSAGAGINYGV